MTEEQKYRVETGGQNHKPVPVRTFEENGGISEKPLNKLCC